MTREPVQLTGLLADWPRTRLADWRARSRIALVLDVVVGLVGVALVSVPLLDAIRTFWSNEVLIYPARLLFVGGILLLCSWPWVLGSALMIWGTSPRGRTGRRIWNLRPVHWRGVAPWVVSFGIIVGFWIAGFVIGASKGSLRILPNGVHQVSAVDLNSSAWTTVSSADYQVWAARFIREDAALALFGLVVVGFVIVMWNLRRQLRSADSD